MFILHSPDDGETSPSTTLETPVATKPAERGRIYETRVGHTLGIAQVSARHLRQKLLDARSTSVAPMQKTNTSHPDCLAALGDGEEWVRELTHRPPQGAEAPDDPSIPSTP